MPTKLTGFPSTAYVGVEAASPPNITQHTDDPTTQNYYNFNTGDLWLNSQPNIPTKGNPLNSTYRLWMLVAKVDFVATWIMISGGAGSVIALQGAENGVPVGAPVFPIAGIIQCNNTDGFIDIRAGSPNPNNLNFNLSANFISTGTFTPVLNFGGTHAGISQTGGGDYSIIGKTVFFGCTVALTNKGMLDTGAATIDISGIPVVGTKANDFMVQGTFLTLSMGQSLFFSNNIALSTSVSLIQGNVTGGAATNMTDTNFANNSVITVTGFFWTF